MSRQKRKAQLYCSASLKQRWKQSQRLLLEVLYRERGTRRTKCEAGEISAGARVPSYLGNPNNTYHSEQVLLGRVKQRLRMLPQV